MAKERRFDATGPAVRRLAVVLAVSAGIAGSAMASDPFGVAQHAVMTLFIEPLRIKHAELAISAEPFPAECSALAITIRVLVPTKHNRKEVLRVDTVVFDDRIHFLGVVGPALLNSDHRPSKESINHAITFFSQINGWQPIDEPPRRGAHPGYMERRMRDMHPRDYEANMKMIVFLELTGVPVSVGSPPSPTATNCGADPNHLRPEP
jgi:hypothetical protein